MICPRWPDVAHRTEQLGDRLAAIGLRVVPVHGLMGVGERDRAAAALRAGEVDVVVASVEAVRDGTLVGPWSPRAGVIVLDGLSAADAAALSAETAARPVHRGRRRRGGGGAGARAPGVPCCCATIRRGR